MGMRESLVRQQDLIDFRLLSSKITIVGAGAVGSVVSLGLAKMGFVNQTIYDADDVDIVNMNCQLYGPKHIGMSKVKALEDMFEIYTGNSKLAEFKNEWFEENMFIDGVVISALDSMDGRISILNSALKYGVKYLIDPRMSIEYGVIYTVDLSDKDKVANYKKSLHSDEEAVQDRCTMKSVMYTPYILGGMVCKAVKDLIVNGNTFSNMMYNIAENDCLFVA